MFKIGHKFKPKIDFRPAKVDIYAEKYVPLRFN